MARFCVLMSVVAALFLGARCEAGAGGEGPGRTGFFLIAAEADSAAKLPPANDTQQVVLYDYHLLQESERGTPVFLLLSKVPDVEVILSGKPELLEEGGNGNPELHLSLTPESAAKLEKLTAEHLGARVAFVIDGEPVTLHKIRAAITGGKFMLTRCTGTACRYLYARLVER